MKGRRLAALVSIPVYSTNLLDLFNITSSSGHQTFTTPNGYVAVCKWFGVFTSSSSTGFIIDVVGIHGTLIGNFANTTNIYSVWTPSGYVVPAGSSCGYAVSSGTWNAWISGYLLTSS